MLVRVQIPPPALCFCGGTGIRVRLRTVCPKGLRVQIPPEALISLWRNGNTQPAQTRLRKLMGVQISRWRLSAVRP